MRYNCNHMRWKKIILISLPIILVGLPLAVAGAFYLAYQNKIYPQTNLGPWNVSGLTKTKAEDFLNKKLRLPSEIKFAYQEKEWSISPNEINLSYQIDHSVEQAYQQSRQQFLANGIKKKFIPLAYSFNEPEFEAKLADLAAQIDRDTIPNQILINETQEIEVEVGKPGIELDADQTKKDFENHLQIYQLHQPFSLIVKQKSSFPTDQEIEQAKQRAEKLINKSLTLSSENQNFVIQEEQLINFVGFQQDWDTEKIKEYVNLISQSINQEAENALFEFDQGRVVTFKPHKTGYQLDENYTIDQIKQGLNQLSKKENSAVKDLKIDQTEPKIKTSDTNRFGVTRLIGQGESTFYNSIPSRIHNIDLASHRLHGILIAPGEIFSMDKALGEVTTATGYQQAYIIKDGQTILGDGGGVCQVSTTLFRAVLNTGLEIIERHPHAYRVNYYEQDKPPGFDATVYFPTSDFKFKNDTDNYILIQREFQRNNSYLSFKFYGTPDNREVIISNERLWAQVPPPEPIYIDDPSLAPGETKQTEKPVWGAKAAFDWQVIKNKEIIHEQTFFSDYQPWPARFLRGVEN